MAPHVNFDGLLFEVRHEGVKARGPFIVLPPTCFLIVRCGVQRGVSKVMLDVESQGRLGRQATSLLSASSKRLQLLHVSGHILLWFGGRKTILAALIPELILNEGKVECQRRSIHTCFQQCLLFRTSMSFLGRRRASEKPRFTASFKTSAISTSVILKEASGTGKQAQRSAPKTVFDTVFL